MDNHRTNGRGPSTAGHHFTQSGWVRVSRSEPCPICGKPDNCTVSGDGTAVWCGRVSDGGIRQNAGGQWLHIIGQRERVEWWAHPGHKRIPPKPKSKPVDLQGVLERAAGADRQERLIELAEVLGVGVESLAELDVGYGHIHGSECWTFPERDGEGRVIGISRRLLNHSKRSIAGGERGLTYSDSWDRGGPVLLVEGGSDTSALMTLGLSAIGRPSNCGGVELLADLIELEPAITPERLIMVVGEDDRLKAGKPREVPADHKPDCQGCGICWPGLDGARRTAKGLAELLGRPVSYAMPPDGAKDSREWLQQFGGDDPAEAAARFIFGLAQSAVVVDPPAQLPVVPIGKDDRPVRELADIRADLQASRSAVVGRPGVYLDRSETGTGKTTADLRVAVELAQSGEKSLLLVPTHANGAELLAAASVMLAQLPEPVPTVAKYPQRVSNRTAEETGEPANCWNGAADIAQGMGLNVFQTVCCRCKKQDLCKASGYMAGLRQATGADIAIACQARAAAQGLNELAAGRHFVAVHEDPTDMLRPSAAVSESDIGAAATVLGQALNDPRNLGTDEADGLDDDAWDSARHLLAVAESLAESLRVAESTGPIPLGEGQPTVRAMFGVLLRSTWWERSTVPGLLKSDAWKLLLAAAAGELAELHVCVDHPFKPNGGGDRAVVKTLFGIWPNAIPSAAATVLADGTADLSAIERLAGPVLDITPDGRADPVHRAVQIPLDITKRGSAKRAAAIVRGVLADRPEWEHIGIICHREHAAEFRDLPTVCKVAYFGQGDERSSNDWHSDCDVVVVSGTPRVNPAAIRQWLLLHGLVVAAAIPEPEWKPYLWTAETDEGRPTAVKAGGYVDPDWQAGYLALVRAELRQCIGRGRITLPDGVPVVVVSVEVCGLPITSLAAEPLDETGAKVLELLAGATAVSPIEDPIGKSAVISPVPTARLLADLRAAGVDIQVRRLRDILGGLELRGLVLRVGERKGWLPVRHCREPDGGQSHGHGGTSDREKTSDEVSVPAAVPVVVLRGPRVLAACPVVAGAEIELRLLE